jgi:hypothetical protein
MEREEILTTFANRFVTKAFRQRFVHEAMKKPIALHRRICHDIEKVFDANHQGKTPSFTDSDECLFLDWTSGFTTTTWKEAQTRMSCGGGGYLVIRVDGGAFYAETEAYPAVAYAGCS